MSVQQFAEHLAAFDSADLTRLLELRPDVLVEPAPGNFLQLAQRLSAPGSISAALWELTLTSATVARAVIALGSAATTSGLAGLLEITEDGATDEIDALRGLGLAWRDNNEVVRVLPALRGPLIGPLGGSGPFRVLAEYIRVPELQHAARALGVEATGGKATLVRALRRVFANRLLTARIIDRLTDDETDTLFQLLNGDPILSYGLTYGPASKDPDSPLQRLRDAGLIFVSNSRVVVPDEVAMAAYLLTTPFTMPEPPMIPDAGTSSDQARTAASSAAEHALRAVTSLLDDAACTPIVALKKGGVGSRERGRLARRLGLPDEQLPLWLDVAYGAGLLTFQGKGYGPSAAYAEWREATPARQWAALALSWLNLDFTPSRRSQESDNDAAPPHPIVTGGGGVRRRLLRAAEPQQSVAAIARNILWFCPISVAEDGDLGPAIVSEAELLGVVGLDSISELGQHLLGVRPVRAAPRQVNMKPDRLGYDEAAADELAAYCTDLLDDTESRLILQSDLTAVVSGRATPAVARLLRAAAVPEARGSAETWRFSTTSVRQAMDAGWTAEELLAALTEAAAHDLPHTLTQLVDDVARRHGEVRVREVRTCLVAAQPLATEICHTRSLAKLSLSQVAPTVLVSPAAPEMVLPALRTAGFLPVTEDADGVVVVPARNEARAAAADNTRTPTAPRARRLTAAELVERLRSEAPTLETSPTFTQLAEHNRLLNNSELNLLADALDRGSDVVISYSDVNSTLSTRQIQPRMLVDRWVIAFCRLRNDERQFAVESIQAVSPVL